MIRKKDQTYSNPEYRKDCKKYHKRFVEKKKKVFAAWLAQGCKVRGCKMEDIGYLEAHHIDRKTKNFSVGTAVKSGVSMTRLLEELKLCVPICVKCHRQLEGYLRAGAEIPKKFKGLYVRPDPD